MKTEEKEEEKKEKTEVVAWKPDGNIATAAAAALSSAAVKAKVYSFTKVYFLNFLEISVFQSFLNHIFNPVVR